MSGQDGGGIWAVARLAHIKSMIRTTYPDRICYRPGCDVCECRVLLPEGVRIGERIACPLGESEWSFSG